MNELNEVTYTLRNKNTGKMINWATQTLAQRLMLQGWDCVSKSNEKPIEDVKPIIITETVKPIEVLESDVVEIVEILAEEALDGFTTPIDETTLENLNQPVKSNGRSKKNNKNN